MAMYDEIRDQFKGKPKGKPKEKMEMEEKKSPKNKKKMGTTSALVGAAGLPKKGIDLLMPLGSKGAAFGLLGDKLRKKQVKYAVEYSISAGFCLS